MKTHRILVINNDLQLLNFYQAKLKKYGFSVDSAQTLEQGRELLAKSESDVVLMDVIFPHGDALEFIGSIRAASATAWLPILILPSVLTQDGDRWLRAGATGTIPPGGNVVASIIDGVITSLELPGLGDAAEAALSRLEDSEVQAITGSSLESINQMRRCLPGIARSAPELSALYYLRSLTHGFAQKAALVASKPLAVFAAALDQLLQDLKRTPRLLNPSTVGTVGQAIDFLATITRPSCMHDLADPSNARFMVVDDEENARQFIGTALELANLKNESAETPSHAIEKLDGKPAGVIFLDVGLPGTDGFDLCAEIRAMDDHKRTPIVFITGMATFQNKVKAKLSGGNDFIGKPFNISELGVVALTWLYRSQLGML